MRDRTFENQQSANYSNVLSAAIAIREILSEINKERQGKEGQTPEVTDAPTTSSQVRANCALKVAGSGSAKGQIQGIKSGCHHGPKERKK